MFGFAGTRSWVYVQHIQGRFQRLRRWTFVGLHLILFGLPWLRVGGNPALLFDLPGRRLYAFGATFTAADTILLLIVLLFLAFSLFFFTALFGRLWCGYACPQTVLLDAWVHPVERWIEGERTTRIRRDNGPWTLDRVGRKAAKWALFLLAAFVVSMSFMSFFTPARMLWSGAAGTASYALVAFFTGVWFLDFTWFREQFCNFLCPYARFQSVMVDDQTLTIAYDAARGEPRGGRDAKAAGRCIECSKCVTVCPAGIDIRNGFQLECIGCARCIDACSDVMGRFGHETLIGYGNLASLRGGRTRFWRPRTVGYAALLTGLTAALSLLLVLRVPFDASVSRRPAPPTPWIPTDSSATPTCSGYRTTSPGSRYPSRSTWRASRARSSRRRGWNWNPREGRMVPLVVRLPQERATGRSLPLKMRIGSSRAGERTLETTFMTAGDGAGP
jgi:cytochrome c oxidase accessory protein FixG